jgi:hypothetical protein
MVRELARMLEWRSCHCIHDSLRAILRLMLIAIEDLAQVLPTDISLTIEHTSPVATYCLS